MDINLENIDAINEDNEKAKEYLDQLILSDDHSSDVNPGNNQS